MLNSFIGRCMENTAFFTAKHPRIRAISQKGFTTLAGLAAGFHPLPAAAECCTGPGGSGQCASGDCNQYSCQRYCTRYPYHCVANVNTSCWRSWVSGCSGTCCDCSCNNGYASWFCYCYGSI
jgi:hypothetical protein